MEKDEVQAGQGRWIMSVFVVLSGFILNRFRVFS